MDAPDLGPYAFIRAEKIRTKRQLLAAMKHNDRTAPDGLEHTDPSRPPELVAGHPDAVEAWEAAMASKGLDPTKPRKGAVVAVEWLATASPEWWATASAEQRAAWTADTLAFVADEMAGPVRPGEAPEARAERGRGLILAAHYHDDETTPHLHILAVPLVEKERAARGKPRKRDAGKPRPPSAPTWDLAAKSILGGPRDRMSELQTDYAAAVAHHGLKRGIPKKETGAFNQRPSHYRAEQAHLTAAIAQERDAAAKDRAIAAGDRKDAEGDRMASLADRSKAADILAKADETGARRRNNIVANAQDEAKAIIAAAMADAAAIKQAAAQALAKAQAFAQTLRADAKRLSIAISFYPYEDDPHTPEARAAVDDRERRLRQEEQDQKKRNAATSAPALSAFDRLKLRGRGDRGRGD